MPGTLDLALFLGAALLIAVSPGPGIFGVAARTLAGGRRDGIASSFGTALGGMVHVLGGALGVSALVLASAEAFTLLKLAGAAYLVWLGIRTWRAVAMPIATAVDVVVAFAASSVGLLAARAALVRRLRRASGTVLCALGLSLLLARRQG